MAEKEKKLNVEVYRAISTDEIEEMEKNWRNKRFLEVFPHAINTPFKEIALNVLPDRHGEWSAPILYYITRHNTLIGARSLGRQAETWYEKEAADKDLDILSISAGMENGELILKVLIRAYNELPDIKDFFDYIGGDLIFDKSSKKHLQTGELLILNESAPVEYTKEQIDNHKSIIKKQQEMIRSSTIQMPFLNSITHYERRKLYDPRDHDTMIYNINSRDACLSIITPQDSFNGIFRYVMNQASGVEYYNYINVIRGEDSKESFLALLRSLIIDKFIDDKTDGMSLTPEDLPIMMERIYNALFKLYIIQDLIDDPRISDIKITAPDSIRVTVEGKTYLSNIHFVDEKDYLRFIDAICIKNNVSKNNPAQTFTDSHDENYILRFSLIAAFTSSENRPYLHIRKIARKKLLGNDLIRLGMFDEKIRDYLLDCGKTSRGVVFAGPPESGKTVALNWFLEEAYEDSAEILVIQENDELFTYKKGVMFQHPINYSYGGYPEVSLEELGKLALVAGANVFIIGEAKGGEICSAITLSNSGCRTAITIHSPSSTETLDKMADLAMRGINQTYERAMESLKSFQTIVYLQDFKVMEISEVRGYNRITKEIEYNYIYRRTPKTA